MVFADLFFIYLFLPLCLISYLLAKKLKVKNIVLIIFSVIFYAWGEPVWVLLLLFSSFMNWYAGILMEKHRDMRIPEQLDCASEILAVKIKVIVESQISYKFSIAHQFQLQDLILIAFSDHQCKIFVTKMLHIFCIYNLCLH